MLTCAYCAKSMSTSVRWAAGATPRTCPPDGLATFTPAWWTGAAFVYLKLHGLPEQPFLYGDEWQTALSAAQIGACDLRGVVVYAPACYLNRSPVLGALLDAGAEAVIGGENANYAQPVLGLDIAVDWLGRSLRRYLELRERPADALELAKRVLRRLPQTRAVRDALEFKVWRA